MATSLNLVTGGYQSDFAQDSWTSWSGKLRTAAELWVLSLMVVLLVCSRRKDNVNKKR